MTWIRTIPKSEADAKLLHAIEAQRELYPIEYADPVHPTGDGTSDIVASHSLISDALYHAFATFGALMSPDLPLARRQHEMISTMVSVTNRCVYWIDSHAEFLRRVTLDEGLVRALRENYKTAPITEPERTMLDYVVKLTKDATQVTPEDHDVLRAAGFGDKAILQITLIASWFNYINRVADALGVGREWQIDPWTAESLPQWTALANHLYGVWSRHILSCDEQTAMRILLRIAGSLIGAYTVICGALYVVMLQSPDVFAGVMRHVPWPALSALPFKSLWLTARTGSVRLGDPAPDFLLERVDQKGQIRLSSLRGQKPVVLVFGSYTWPPFRREVPALNRLYEQYKDQAAFYAVYIREAHTTDVWQDPDNLDAHILYAKPKSLAERFQIGQTCVVRLGIKFPAVVDTFDNAVERAYTGWPDRLYVIDRNGRVAYRSLPGPYGFHPKGVADTLQKLVSIPIPVN